jgi:Tol biopolymer transport system component
VSEQGVLDELVWINLKGESETILRKNTQLWGPRISPDGKKIAMWYSDDTRGHVFVYDLDRDFFDKLTREGDNFWPVWTPDGNKIAFPSIRGGTLVDIFWKATDKSTPAESLLENKINEGMMENTYQPQDWSTDSRYLLFVTSRGLDIGWDIMIMDMENNRKISEFIATEHSERHPRLSPDNNWLAYQSNESGRLEIYVTRFPQKGAKWQISNDGGEEPIWSPDGRKLYYRFRENLYAVEISTEPDFTASKPEILFKGKFRQNMFGWYYDIHPDGDKFVMVKGAKIDTSRNQVNIIKNFDREIDNKFAALH